ncbi:hypothetical protein FDP41_009716 [Naegleria fowleri]|uniref:2Fe-2S ferredoxin-type domain-containing protein n=1 Tax=Naegleria fowleri TaxID=5763 RepID=A0A6A5BD68_NAEFO|nr:uncharacterized protein FDP41_009716 [Naegleria fowleri]KAF0972020.1 hypothetical protein FDP41_009716 [Naegleria fowleri]CAG4711675.1 unnamed protein product [Naegleria fowleri]
MSQLKTVLIKTSLKTLQVPVGSNLRQVLLENDIPLYNGNTQTFNCGGRGVCGTCAVQVKSNVDGGLSNTKLMKRTLGEEIRLKLPPHDLNQDIRLACQCTVEEDIEVQKFDGVCGHKYEKKVW